MIPKLIITADDYGLCAEVNEGIRDCIQGGAVTSVQVLTNLVTDAEMQKLLVTIDLAEKKWGKRCGIGLHFNTTQGPALSAKPTSTLVDSSQPGNLFHTMRTIECDQIEEKDVREELEQQMTRLSHFLGGSEYIDSISSHHNIHFFSPAFSEVLLNYAQDGIPFRSPVQWRLEGDEPHPDKFKKWYKLLPIVIDSGLTYKNAKQSTRRVLKNAADYDFLKNQRDAMHLHHSATPINCSEQWYGQPSYDCLVWVVNEMQRLQKAYDEIHMQRQQPLQSYISELYTHIASAEGHQQFDLTYSMRRRVAEYDVWRLYKVKTFLEECHKGFHPVELCSYRDALSVTV